MKYISWNVNGLRACVGKGFMDYFNETGADAFCLQETKLSPDQIKLDMPGYTVLHWPRTDLPSILSIANEPRLSPIKLRTAPAAVIMSIGTT